MGKIPQGILGGISGKIGGVVGSSWKGINVLKTLPLSVANPKTAAQIAQRSKFSNTVSFAGIILAQVIKPLWDRFASRMSGYNDFIKTNINLFVGTYPNPLPDLVISKGKMSLTAIGGATASEASGLITVPWTDDSGEGFKLTTDVPYIVVFNADSDCSDGFETAVQRDAATVDVEPAVALANGDALHLYLAFKRADGTVVSNTSYKTINCGA